jgi:transcriptional regulator GlxA family with amidase domain
VKLLNKSEQLEPQSHTKLKVGFILARSFTLSAFALFVDTLRLASDEADNSGRVRADWQVLSSSRHFITSSCGVQVAPTSAFVEPNRFDYIVVVGGLLGADDPIDAESIAWLKRAAIARVPLIGVCTGTFILAAAGLLRQHETCVSWLHYQAFREFFPDHRVRSDRIFNLDRMRGSCAGGSSAADMAASIVQRHIGKNAARKAMEVLQMERVRTDRDLQPRRPLGIKCRDTRLRSVLLKMEGHLDGSLSIRGLADEIGLCRRQLERLFAEEIKMTPTNVYKRIRMEHAKGLLMRSDSSVIDIAMEIGFSSTAHFTRVFRSIYGKTPTQVRISTSPAQLMHG